MPFEITTAAISPPGSARGRKSNSHSARLMAPVRNVGSPSSAGFPTGAGAAATSTDSGVSAGALMPVSPHNRGVGPLCTRRFRRRIVWSPATFGRTLRSPGR